ncbi:MAG: BtrH N-terminal domain-containing protein [Tumebacillaceae bacterium]
MIRTRHPHCLYDAVSKTLQQAYSLDLDQSLIYHLFGGFCFSVEDLKNDKVPSYTTRGNQLQYSKFETLTGIRVAQQKDVLEERAWKTTMHNLAENGYQLVLTNCFFLPYDTANYKKNTENHLVLIHSYDEEQETFCVSDSCFDRVTIDREALMKARLKTLPSYNKYQSLKVEPKEVRDRETILELIRRDVIAQAADFETQSDFDVFRRYLHEIEAAEGIIRKVACNNLCKDLHHPSSVVTTRELMGDSLDILFPGLEHGYQELSAAWASLSTNIVRWSHGTVELAALLEMFEQIAAQELACNRIVKEL